MSEPNGLIFGIVLALISLPFAGVAYLIQTYGGVLSGLGIAPLLIAAMLMLVAAIYATGGVLNLMRDYVFAEVRDIE